MRHFYLVVGILLALGAGVWGAHVSSVRAQAGTEQAITISAKKYEFTPGEIHVKAGTRVTLTVHSEDGTHGVKLDLYPEGTKRSGVPGLLFADLALNGKVTKGEDQVLIFVAGTPGTYDFQCAHICGMGHPRTKGKLIVDPQGAGQ
jgi:cytochrome c oxidase subunit 2